MAEWDLIGELDPGDDAAPRAARQARPAGGRGAVAVARGVATSLDEARVDQFGGRWR